MKALNLRELCKIAALMAIVVFFSTSCNDDDPVLPDYAGTWVGVKVVPTGSGYTQMKDIMTFTETSFTKTDQVQVSTDNWTGKVSVKGSMMVTGDIMSVTVTEIGVSSLSGVDSQPTGVFTFYKKGSSEFDALLSTYNQPKTFELKYTTSDKQLSLQIDSNGDGDYLDASETSVYTKQ